MLSLSGWLALSAKVKRGAISKVCVHPSNECGPAWKTRRARPEGHIRCALSLGKGATLSVATKHNSCTLQATLNTQEALQRLLHCRNWAEMSFPHMG
ncbi:hypothetical protein T9A_01283 [Alcanivorax jadensis T9]|uniref:Secreted protein n=1 Tax=Alcanivorax jadensis T9 TaxID=1177181 RepID=A0ABR4WEZ8_9GAMM|nr:hypothetical protein T9A_01283 [Alcanivorax jadensis T9]